MLNAMKKVKTPFTASLSRLIAIASVIDQCGLRRDLEILDAGDLTEVGDKGLTLRYCSARVAKESSSKPYMSVAGKRYVRAEVMVAHFKNS